MKFKPNTFVTVPNRHLFEYMKPSALSVYVRLVYRMNDVGLCWPSIASLKKETNVGKDGVYQAIKDLESLGVITTTPRFNKSGQTSSAYQIMVVDGVPNGAVKPTRKTRSNRVLVGGYQNKDTSSSEYQNKDTPPSQNKDTELNPVELNNSSDPLKAGRTDEFVFKDQLKKLADDTNRPDSQLVAKYWHMQRVSFPTRASYQKRFRGDVAQVKNMLKQGYTASEIAKCMNYCENSFPSWTLGAVAKYLPKSYGAKKALEK